MPPQLGLTHFWIQGDWITRSVALLLLLMSLASWMVIALKTLDLLQCRRYARRVDAFWRCPDYDAGLAQLQAPEHNPFHSLAQSSRDAASHHEDARQQLQHALDVSDWITRSLRNSIDDSTARLQSGLAILASVGSTAPFIGLFGTVWGIYHALLGIGAAGQATIDQVAGPIGEALIMTALGLAVAIPAVLGYNALVRGNKTIVMRLNRFAHDLHAYFMTGARVGGDPRERKPPGAEQAPSN